PIVAIMNEYYFQVYLDAFDDIAPKDYTLPFTEEYLKEKQKEKLGEPLKTQKQILAEQIFDLASEQFQKISSEEEKPKPVLNENGVKALIMTIISLIVIGLVQYQLKRKQSQIKKSSVDEDKASDEQTKNENGDNVPLVKKRFPRFGEEPVPQTSIEEMVKSSFGRASFTAKLLKHRSTSNINTWSRSEN
ncbi:MAG: hypothetical protein ACHP6I_00770, partial [Rickettsiales bacterium]